jgi:hypothetical protein
MEGRVPGTVRDQGGLEFESDPVVGTGNPPVVLNQDGQEFPGAGRISGPAHMVGNWYRAPRVRLQPAENARHKRITRTYGDPAGGTQLRSSR